MMGAQNPTTMSVLNIETAIRFLKIIAPDGNITFQTFDDNKVSKNQRLCRILHGATEENFAALSRLNQAGAGIFFMVNIGDCSGRKAANVTEVRAIFVDLDEDGSVKLERIRGLEAGGPRVVVESSPGKYHAYWQIDEALPLECFTPLQKHFGKHFGGDPAVCDLPRVMRVPGFFHKKSTPFKTRIVFENLEAKSLPADILIKKARVLTTQKVTVSTESRNSEFLIKAGPQGLMPKLLDALQHIDPQPYTKWLKIGMALHHESGGGEDGLNEYVAWSSKADNFDDKACRGKWNSFGRNTGEVITAGTVYELARKNGWVGLHAENLTDAGNGKRLLRHFGEDLRFVPEAGRWIIYDDGRWEWDRDGGIFRCAKKTTDLMIQEARKTNDDGQRQRLIKHALASENSFRLKAMIDLGSTEQKAVLHQSSLDRDPDLLGIANGVLNLKTGEIRPGRRDDYMTKKSNVEMTGSAGGCPVWLSFLERVLDGSEDLINYLQRAIGYTLTGHTSEQCLFFLYGTGANGKSTFLNVLRGLMGDYCKIIDPETIMFNSNSGGATPELARLMGTRAVITNEIDEGKRLAENRIKQMTGGDIMIARHLYREPFEFKPEFKIFMAGNHKPTIKGTDHAIWRRIHLIPFTVTILKNEQDHKLADKLKAELPGILHWAVEGAQEWRKHGLQPPRQIKAAVDDYRDEMDTMGHWL
ncbi:MAG: hypothetical protein GWP06_17770, partial [Actinobacteria bacterium]|nr:hypothetical protein [Actinomycetota bacterium]